MFNCEAASCDLLFEAGVWRFCVWYFLKRLSTDTQRTGTTTYTQTIALSWTQRAATPTNARRRLLEVCSSASTLPPFQCLLLECLSDYLGMFCRDNAPVLGKPIPVMVSTCKQLREAGLAQCLQPFTDAVVAGLQLLTPPAAIEQQLLSPELPSSLQTSWSAAVHLFKLLDQLYSVFPTREYTAELAAVKQACTMQLSTATFQNLSRCLEHMPPQLSSPPQIVTDQLDWTPGCHHAAGADIRDAAAGRGAGRQGCPVLRC